MWLTGLRLQHIHSPQRLYNDIRQSWLYSNQPESEIRSERKESRLTITGDEHQGPASSEEVWTRPVIYSPPPCKSHCNAWGKVCTRLKKGKVQYPMPSRWSQGQTVDIKGIFSYCALPFMANVTISTSISQTFLSWVAIFHLRQTMVCLSHSSCGIAGLAPLMNVLFWEGHDFHVSFSDRDMSGNVWKRLSGSSMVDMGISSNIIKPPLPNVTWHSGTWSYTATPAIH